MKLRIKIYRRDNKNGKEEPVKILVNYYAKNLNNKIVKKEGENYEK